MSTPHNEEEDLAPSSTPGYRPGQEKSIDELAKLDAEDESLARWKASLGIVPGAGGAAQPKVTVVAMELASPTMPAGKKLVMDLTDPNALGNQTFTIKEGVPYNVRIRFKVDAGISSGVRYIQLVKRAGIKVDKMEQMLGSFAAGPSVIEKNFPEDESPSGLIARSGTYSVRSRVIDDDKNVYADWEWTFKLGKEW